MFPRSFPISLPSKKLPGRVGTELVECARDQIQGKHYSALTEVIYAYWVREFIPFHEAKSGTCHHPGELGSIEVYQFLTHLAVDKNVAASTQNQGLSALGFFDAPTSHPRNSHSKNCLSSRENVWRDQVCDSPLHVF